MTWLALAVAVAKLLLWIVQKVDQHQWMATGEARALERIADEHKKRVAEARAARDAVDHSRLPDDDPYRRD